MTVLLDRTSAPAQTATPGPRNIISVFRVEGPLTEVPAQEDFLGLSLPTTSLKELVARLNKAADDASVKAVVILPDRASIGLAQVEELSAAIGAVPCSTWPRLTCSTSIPAARRSSSRSCAGWRFSSAKAWC